MLSQVRIERSSQTEPLYRSEDGAQRAIEAAAADLAKALPNCRLEREDALTLELAAVLEHFGGSGARAARLVVERYGEDDPDGQSEAGTTGLPPEMPKPDAVKTLAYLGDLHSHSVYKVDSVYEKLRECGFFMERVVKVKGLRANGIWMRPIDPEWGDPGIDPSSVLEAAFLVLTGEEPRSECAGRGFRFDDILNQLRRRLRSRESE